MLGWLHRQAHASVRPSKRQGWLRCTLSGAQLPGYGVWLLSGGVGSSPWRLNSANVELRGQAVLQDPGRPPPQILRKRHRPCMHRRFTAFPLLMIDMLLIDLTQLLCNQNHNQNAKAGNFMSLQVLDMVC